jgi:L-lactate dehydrogenase complex protein LldG
MQSIDLVTDEDVVSRLLGEFQARVEPLGVEVARIAAVEAGAAWLAAWGMALGAVEAVVSSEVTAAASSFSDALAERGLQAVAPESPAQVRDAPFGISLAHLAVAETGSLLLAEPTLEDRAVGLLTLAQAIVCPTNALVPSLDEAGAALRRLALAPGRGMATLVTGPSRTADIERVLTVGVQGPGKVAVVFIDELGP